MPCTTARPQAVPKRLDDIIDIMPCFFDLQVQSVIKVLQISSHTLKRIRQEVSLDRWPFEKISRGKSVLWRGEAMGWEEIQQFRTRVLPTVSREMQDVLHACDRKGVLMRALYLPGYAQRMRGTILREHEADQMHAFAQGAIPARVLTPKAEKKNPKAVVEPVFLEEDRALLDEIGLLEFAEIHGGAAAGPPQADGDSLSLYRPEGWAGLEEDEYWADVGRHLFEL